MNTRTTLLGALAAAALALPALAQSNVTNATKFSWGENIGWMNWRDAGVVAGSQGAVLDLGQGFLEGSIWCENIGWVSLGVAAGGPYTNTTNANYGVNMNPCSGNLSGFAWGENVGWINFRGGALAAPANPARFDFTDRRLRGYAWGENIGWISLDEPTNPFGKYVGFTFPGNLCDCIDFNRDDVFPDSQDISDYLSVFGGGACSNDPDCGDIDFNNDGVSPDSVDIETFLRVFSGGPC